MAITERNFDGSPSDVFDVLLDARQYPNWVVGAKSIRAVDDDWPRVGSAFHHRLGAGAAEVTDRTEILDLDAPHRIELRTYARPLGVARVVITARRAGDGTIVAISEQPETGTRMRMVARLLDPLIHVRNVESLRRLEHVVRILRSHGETQREPARG
jgi:uncharacterized protein YndB with AHSA1/START domain